MEKTVSEAIAYRRAVRVFRDTPIDPLEVRKCIANGILAPTSSNLQLWEFLHVTSPELLETLTAACFGQNAARTARQMVVVVARRDAWRQRAKANAAFLKEQFSKTGGEKWKRRERLAMKYYHQLIPILYTEFLGLIGWVRYAFLTVFGIFRPVYRQVRRSDMRVVAHKSAALAAENFMVSMAAIGYDTCPMEGFDSLRVKKALKLPWRAEVTMIIGCGVRDADKGIYGPRFRIPFEEVYRQL
jgi:nitroreductase